MGRRSDRQDERRRRRGAPGGPGSRNLRRLDPKVVFGKAQADATHLAVLEGPPVQVPEGLRRAGYIIKLDIARRSIRPRMQAHPLVAGLRGENFLQLALRGLHGQVADIEDVAARVLVTGDARGNICSSWDGPCAVSSLGIPDKLWGYGRKRVVCVG